jgi:hypothetical protein
MPAGFSISSLSGVFLLLLKNSTAAMGISAVNNCHVISAFLYIIIIRPADLYSSRVHCQPPAGHFLSTPCYCIACPKHRHGLSFSIISCR